MALVMPGIVIVGANRDLRSDLVNFKTRPRDILLRVMDAVRVCRSEVRRVVLTAREALCSHRERVDASDLCFANTLQLRCLSGERCIL